MNAIKLLAIITVLGSLVAWHLTPVQSFEPEDFSLLQDTGNAGPIRNSENTYEQRGTISGGAEVHHGVHDAFAVATEIGERLRSGLRGSPGNGLRERAEHRQKRGERGEEAQAISRRVNTAAPKVKPYDGGGWRTLSVYSTYYVGRKMSNGIPYSPDKLTVASNDWKLGTKLRLTSEFGAVAVVVTDRLAKRFSGKRVDGSGEVWRLLSNGKKPGLLRVRVEVLK